MKNVLITCAPKLETYFKEQKDTLEKTKHKLHPKTREFNQSTYGSLSIGTDSQTIKNKYETTFVDFFLLTFKIKLIEQLIENCSYAKSLKSYPTNFNIFENGIVELTVNVSDEDLIKTINDYSNNNLIANNVIDVFRNIFKTNKDTIIRKYKEYFDVVKRNVYIINGMAIPSTHNNNNSSFQSKNDPRLEKAIAALFGGNRTQQPVYIRTQEKLKTSKGMRCIYLGKRGGQYVKIDGQFHSVKSLTK